MLSAWPRKMTEIERTTPPVEMLDITLYRDDLSSMDQKPVVQPAAPFSVEAKTAILVDDVLYTGRTTRAALDALLEHGRPRRVELCVLIDRGHRELPIQANYVAGSCRQRTTKSLKSAFAKWTTRTASCFASATNRSEGVICNIPLDPKM